MKKGLKIIGFVFGGLIVIALVVGFIFTNGLEEGANVSVGSIDLSQTPDGAYEGKYTLNRWKNTLIVHVENHRIVSIDVEKDVMIQLDTVTQGVIDEVLAKQSLDIDIQAGATVTTKAYLKAIEDALDGE
ncbi:MAG: FMN-binding protein [Erysipelotrichaceae bacterium]